MADDIETPERNISVIILFGVLSVISAEVFSGSSPLWMWDWWGILVVLPLYWGHGMILWNIALRYKKTSLTHLYLLGIIYGLYESWMTKVIWVGYFGQPPQFGQFLGFAIGEFLVIALFWHAVFSFIIPLYMIQLLGGKEGKLARTRRRTFVAISIILLASSFIPIGLGYDLGATMIAVLSNTLVLGIAFGITKFRHPTGFSLSSLRIGKKGWAISIGYTLFLYVFLLFVIRPEAIAPPLTLFLTVGFYALIIGLFWFSKENEYVMDDTTGVPSFARTHVIVGIGAIFMLSLLWIMFSPLAFIIGTLLYLGMIIAGPILLAIAVFRTVTGKV